MITDLLGNSQPNSKMRFFFITLLFILCTHDFSVAILWPGKKRLRNLSTVEIPLEEFPKLMKLFTLNHEIIDTKETLYNRIKLVTIAKWKR